MPITNPLLLHHVKQTAAPEFQNTLEFQLLCDILSGKFPQELASQLRQWGMLYIVAAEWDVVAGRSDLGRGDLVFSDEPLLETPQQHCGRPLAPHAPCKVLIVELKCLSNRTGRNQRVARTAARGEVEAQVVKYMKAWREEFPSDFH